MATLFVPAVVVQSQSGRARREPSQTNSTQGRAPSPNRPRRATPSPTPQPGATIGTGESTPAPPPPPATNDQTPESADASTDVDPDDVIRINSNLVPVPASVVDDSGRAVTDLELKDFELRVDGRPQTISDIARSESPVSMAVLFDNSHSLMSSRELQKQAAIRFFRSVMRPIDKAAIYSVSTEPILEVPLTDSIPALVHAIERFGKPEGTTSLFDAVIQAANYLRRQPTRKVIVIVSDGVDTTSNASFEDTLRSALSADCQIYTVQTGVSRNANLRDLAAERRMQEFASQTGGAVYVPQAAADLDQAFKQIAADLAQQYVLSYYPTDDARDGRFRAIALRVTSRPNLRVRTRKGYYTPKR